MSDVFISYARSSEEQATQVEQALRDAGYGVWRDAELPAHRPYADVIAERLKLAKAVVVLWSGEATRSQWVRAEADAARELGTLIQATVDGTMPPIPFNQIQCADLKGWRGSAEHAGWRKVLASVAALAGGSNEAGQSQQPQRNKTSVCVLPFANMSGDAEQEYFSDGISEDITTDLSKVSALEVVARNSAFMFKGQSVDVTRIASKLGVSHVLEGSVRKAGTRVRITAQLIDGSSGAHLWAERFDRDLTDIFAIQDEISKAIVEALKVKLLPEEKKAIENRDTTSAEAYNLYLMGRQYWVAGNQGDRRREQRVIRICQRAIEIDANYARAWALMAIAQSNLRFGFGELGDDGVTAGERALSINPNIAEAHCPMARRLLEERRFNDAEAIIEAALLLDPNSWEVNKEAARLYLAQRRSADAARHLEVAVSVMKTDFHAWDLLVTCYHALGSSAGMRRSAEMALSQAEAAVAQDPSNGAALGIGASSLAALGKADRAKEWIERAMLIDPDNLNMRYNFACALAVLGEMDGAMEVLEPVFERAGPTIIKIAEADTDFDGLRDNPRFQHMMDSAKSRLASTNTRQ